MHSDQSMSVSIKRAILVEFEPTEDLQPLLQNRSMAMLPVHGRSLAEHWGDRLHDAGIEELLIVSSRFPEQLRRVFQDGERWGFKRIEYLSTPCLQDWPQALTLTRGFGHDNCAFILLNMMPPVLSIDNSEDRASARDSLLTILPTMLPAPSDGAITTIAAYWAVNMQGLDGLADQQIKPNCHISGDARLLGPVSIGSRVVVDRGVTLDRVMIAGLVDIGADTVIRNAVILPNSQIGSQLDICDMVIDGHFIYHVPTQTALYLDDQALFSEVQRPTQSVTLSQRIVALLLIVLTLPLLLSIGLTHQRQTQTLTRVQGRKSNVGHLDELHVVTSFVSDHSKHVRLPWLFSVLGGTLPLFGAREEMSSGVVESLSGVSFAGVISLADFGPDERVARQIANLYQVNVQTRRENFRLTLRWLGAAYSRRETKDLHANVNDLEEWHG
jgi:NDP-sugar pyrophosphorylase family protein